MKKTKKKKQKQNRLRNTKTLNKSSPEIKVPIEYLLIPGRTVVEPIGGENGMLKEMEAEEKVRKLKENYCPRLMLFRSKKCVSSPQKGLLTQPGLTDLLIKLKLKLKEKTKTKTHAYP
jgi:hypothetical protein